MSICSKNTLPAQLISQRTLVRMSMRKNELRRSIFFSFSGSFPLLFLSKKMISAVMTITLSSIGESHSIATAHIPMRIIKI